MSRALNRHSDAQQQIRQLALDPPHDISHLTLSYHLINLLPTAADEVKQFLHSIRGSFDDSEFLAQYITEFSEDEAHAAFQQLGTSSLSDAVICYLYNLYTVYSYRADGINMLEGVLSPLFTIVRENHKSLNVLHAVVSLSRRMREQSVWGKYFPGTAARLLKKERSRITKEFEANDVSRASERSPAYDNREAYSFMKRLFTDLKRQASAQIRALEVAAVRPNSGGMVLGLRLR